MKLTDTFIRRVSGNGKVQKHSDGGGLFLYVTPTGKKSWRMAYRFAGKQKLLSIGPYPTIGLREARDKREEAKKQLLANIDPSSAKQEARATAAEAALNSFEVVAREWFAKHSASWTHEYKRNMIQRLEKNIFPYIGKRPIASITARELLGVLRRPEERNALYTVHRSLRECGRIFRYAIITGRAERDVAADLRGAFAPAPNGHFASITDPAAVGKLLCDLEDYKRNFIISRMLRLAPLVFLRAGELTSAKWEEIDWKAAEWRIPAEKMKMRQMHIVPLSRQALAILEELHEVTGNGRYLFPNRTGDKPLHHMTPLRALRRLGYAVGEHTIHGFRSMASTLLNEQGYNSDWIERQLAHSERNGVRAAYNYAQYLPERRKMMQEYSDYLFALKEKARQECASPTSEAMPETANSGKKRQRKLPQTVSHP